MTEASSNQLCTGAREDALAGTRTSELRSLAAGGASGGLDFGSAGASSRSAKIRNKVVPVCGFPIHCEDANCVVKAAVRTLTDFTIEIYVSLF
jgi:hypothetical protein